MDDPGFRTVFPLDPEAFDAFEAAIADPPPANEPLRALVEVKVEHDDISSREWAAIHRHPAVARQAAREWRAMERAANRAPLSDKVVYPRKLVDAPPPPKRRPGK